MISIIISSARKELLAQVTLNIESTIGIEYEIISFENSTGDKSISTLYNEGARKAKYSLLCFMHEDIVIQTTDWGKIVERCFANQLNLGILGVAGAAYKTYAPSGWDVEGFEGEMKYINYVQSSKQSIYPDQIVYHNAEGINIAPVACVDGMWFSTRKSIALEKPFDEQLLAGFHGYDIDFCLNVGQTYAVAVTFEIIMKHLSMGNFGKDWFLDTLKLYEKWAFILPIKKKDISGIHQVTFEKRAFKRTIRDMLNYGFMRSQALNILVKARKANKISLKLFIKLVIYLYSKSRNTKKS